MNVLTINEKSYSVKGRNIVIRNGVVMVDNEIIEKGVTGTIKVEFKGDLAKLDCTEAIINGNVQGNVDGTSITVNGNVQGDVDGTNINVKGDVGGDVDGTSVNCGNVQGDVDAVTVNRKR